MAFNRRKFLQILSTSLMGFWAVALIYPIIRFVFFAPKQEEGPQDELVVCKVSDIAPGQSKTFRLANKPGLLIQDSNGNYHALNATCSHLGCTVQFRPKEADVFCACHLGQFDLDGGYVAGPPPGPLERYNVTVTDDGSIVVSRA